MPDFSDKLVDEYAHSELYYTLIKLRDNFNSQKLLKDGETYIPHNLEAEFFELLYNSRAEMLNEENFSVTKEINDLVCYVLANVEVGGTRELKNGQTTYNASAVTEYNLYSSYGWAFGGGGELDHMYQHTGKGIGEPDFILTEPFELEIFTKDAGAKKIIIPAGTEIDAKDYMVRENMVIEFSKNTDGKLGHGGNSLFAHIISTGAYYISKNLANEPIYPVLNIQHKVSRRQVKLSLDDQGILIVDYYR